jgi:hypothetical protein
MCRSASLHHTNDQCGTAARLRVFVLVDALELKSGNRISRHAIPEYTCQQEREYKQIRMQQKIRISHLHFKRLPFVRRDHILNWLIAFGVVNLDRLHIFVFPLFLTRI